MEGEGRGGEGRKGEGRGGERRVRAFTHTHTHAHAHTHTRHAHIFLVQCIEAALDPANDLAGTGAGAVISEDL